MNKKDQKIVRRTGSSFFFGGMSLFLFFPYARVTWNIVLFLSALCGVTIAAFALIRVNRRRAAGERDSRRQKAARSVRGGGPQAKAAARSVRGGVPQAKESARGVRE